MNLKNLELFGFKSFMRKLDIHFSDGITVIVGPNGCGKTNVTDALRWVLGEGNARMLRGNRMEDLIFSGTRDYKPLNFAEVSLSIDNTSGVLPVEYPEVTVTRRVFRNGESEFLINRIPGRLRDIHELFMDTGLGSRAYSVIERSMVDMVLSDQPEKRRELLEEAAGIMKYKIRHRQAQRKLEATDEDLHRIGDVLREVERQVRSLRRQVGAARRFEQIRERQRELEIALALVQSSEQGGRQSVLEESRAESVTERDGAAAKTAALEVEIEEVRVRSAEIDRALAEVQREVDERAEEARRIESEKLVRVERQESLRATSDRLAGEREELRRSIREGDERREALEARRTGEEARLAEMRERRREAEACLANFESSLRERKEHLTRAREIQEEALAEGARIRAELANLDAHGEHVVDREAVLVEEIGVLDATRGARARERDEATAIAETIRGEIAGLEAEIDAAGSSQRDLDARREEVRETTARLSVELETARSSLQLLCDLRETREGYAEGPRRLLSREDGPGLTALADSLEVSRALDSALEVAVQFVVAPHDRAALEAVRYLKANDGRATVVDAAAYRDAPRRKRPTVPTDPAVLGRARSFLEVSEELGPVLDDLLDRVILVETLEDALRLAKRPDGSGLRFVAREGDWVEPPGLIHGGASKAAGDSRILDRADRIERLERKVESDRAELEKIGRRIAELDADRARLSARIDTLHARRDERREYLAATERTRERLSAELEAARERLTRIGEERQNVASRHQELNHRREGVLRILEEAEERTGRLEEERRRREDELTASTEDRDRAQRDCHDLRLEEQRLLSELEKISIERQRIDEVRRADEEGIARRTEDLAATDRTVGELAREQSRGEEELAAKATELEERRRARDEVERERSAVVERLRELEEQRNRWSRLRNECAEAVHETELQLQRCESAREELTNRIRHEFSLDLESPEIRETYGVLLDAEDEVLEISRRECDDLRKQIDRMGAVNLMALEQYERESRRLEFLRTQHDDLEEAREKLRRTIRKINRTARSLFMSTLEDVRVNFQRTFGTLFEGGQADVRLVGEEDPLHAPVEIFARPKGKRLHSIALMSSGERALTAVAFLFAIYLVKPSPFCILDEVDAPLDDANIGRFLDMLRTVAHKTQFVMITHNKKTMAIADYLYGVTMEEAGISKLVSVRLGRAGETEPASAGNGDEGVLEEAALVVEGSA
jgi:chromosome segregation protein